MTDPSQPPSHRYITTENIQAGDVILEEEAWVWSFLNLGSAKLACNYCFKPPSDKLKSCSACKSAFYCDAICQRNDWRLRHKHEECQNLKLIRQMAQNIPGATMPNFEEIHFNILVPRLLLSTASARLFHGNERDGSDNPTTPLWSTFMQTPYERDLIDVNVHPASLRSAVCRLIPHTDKPEMLIKNRVLPSLVVLSNHEPWKKALKDQPYAKNIIPMPQQLALGACMEMSKYPHCCDRPNAITINEGRMVRMVAMENIENLGAVRLTRLPMWLYEHRYSRRTAQLYKLFGYGCFCTRCNAGDAAETTLFGLRCPWAKQPFSRCDGSVRGLRRIDIESSEFTTLTGRMEPCADEPNPFSYTVYRADVTPPHERAVCTKCNAKYDAETMTTRILPLLDFMEMFRADPGGLFTTLYDDYPDTWVDKVLEAEKFVYPTNGVYIHAKRLQLRHIMHGVENKLPGLRAGSVAWLKTYLREVLARIEAVGCQQIDLFGLQEIVGFYGHCVEVARKSGGRLTIDAETIELFITTAERATEKLKMLLQVQKE